MLRKFLCLTTCSFMLSACWHPLEPVGNGDIISSSGTRNCSLEDYQAYSTACDQNEVLGVDGDYAETYTAIPRAGWYFERWENYCVNEETNVCSFSFDEEDVSKLSLIHI